MKKKILIIIISFLVLIAIICGVIFVINNFKKNNTTVKEPQKNITDFTDLFNEKQDSYTMIKLGYDINYEVNGKCSISAQIPLLNGDTDNINNINDNIKETFVNTMLNVAYNSQSFTKFDVDYVATEKDGAVSLMIRCSYKAGSNPQRTIIKTYNYDSNTDTIITLDSVLTRKGIEKQTVQDKLFIKAKDANEKNKIINEQGYNVYMRDLTSDIYNLENMTEFYISNNDNLYVIYAYGNQNNTNEMDVVSF